MFFEEVIEVGDFGKTQCIGNFRFEVKMKPTGVSHPDAGVEMKHVEQKMKPSGVSYPDVEVKMKSTGVTDPDAFVKMKPTVSEMKPIEFGNSMLG